MSTGPSSKTFPCVSPHPCRPIPSSRSTSPLRACCRAAHETEGFAATYIRGLEIVMQTQIEGQLRDWKGPPLVLVSPRGAHLMFAFDKTEELIEAGYRATANDARPGRNSSSPNSQGNASDPSASCHGGRRALCRVRLLV